MLILTIVLKAWEVRIPGLAGTTGFVGRYILSKSFSPASSVTAPCDPGVYRAEALDKKLGMALNRLGAKLTVCRIIQLSAESWCELLAISSTWTRIEPHRVSDQCPSG